MTVRSTVVFTIRSVCTAKTIVEVRERRVWVHNIGLLDPCLRPDEYSPPGATDASRIEARRTDDAFTRVLKIERLVQR